MKHIFSTYILILFPLIAFCQAEKQLQPSDLKQQTIVTEPATLRKGYFRIGANMIYSATDKYFNEAGKKTYFQGSGWGSNMSSNLTLQYGVSNRLQVDVSMSYMNILHQSPSTVYVPFADTTADYSYSLKGHGIGDGYVSVKYQILPEKENKTSLTGIVQISIPTGEKNPTNIKNRFNFDLPVGNGNFATAFNLTYRKIHYPYSYSGYVDYTYNLNGTKLINATDSKEKEFKNGSILLFGGNFDFHLNEWIALTNDLSFSYRGKDKIENIVPTGTLTAMRLDYETHLVFQIKQFRLAEAIVIPLMGKNNVPADPQYIVIAQYLF